MARLYIISFTLIFLSTTWAQSIFINNVPEYNQLATCAEQPLSVIVRSMASGCGDGSKTTSYACFCSSSSSKFSSIISREVVKTCSGDSGDVTSALDVFSSYCQIGVAAAATTSGDSSPFSSSPTPANTATTMVTSTTGATVPVATSQASASLSSSSKIVIGVVVPVGCILILGGLTAVALIMRSRRRRAAALAENGIGAKTMTEDSTSDHGSDRSLSPTITTKFHFELESPLVERLESTPPVELPTDGRYGNGTSAHELQE